MVQKKQSILKKIIIGILFLLNVIAAIALLLAFLAQFIKPSFSMVTAYCGLGFIYILYVNLFFAIIWLFIKYPFSLISTILIILNINNIDAHYQTKATEKPTKCVNCLKVMSYNAKLFGLYNSSSPTQRNKDKQEVFNFLRKECPDIFCVQEYFYDASNTLNFHTTDSILSILKLDNNKKYYYQYLPTNTKKKYYFGLAIFSRYKIVNADWVRMNDSTTNKAIYVDIRYKNDTIRVYNIHLSSMKMDANDYKMGKEIANNNFEDPKFNKKAIKISKKISDAFIHRENQAISLREHLDSCQYPVIICGDINDSPSSYCYRKISKGLKDSFRKSGKKQGTTYFGESFPSYRIDYIFHDRQYSDYGHTVCTQIKTSDHYPIYCYISLIKK